MNSEPRTSNPELRTQNVRIAIASSGLGHVARGVETWARDTADALHERGLDVTLFSGAPLHAQVNGAPRVAVPCIRRRTALSRLIVRLMPGFAWRWGLKDGYGLEQLTFWLNLRRQLKRDGFDILHVQDPLVARWCRRARVAGRIATKEILAHGTEEPAEFLAPFDYVQHLLQFHLDAAMQALSLHDQPAGWFVAPNFVDTVRFSPVGWVGRQTTDCRLQTADQGLVGASLAEAQRGEIRRRLGIPEDAFVVGSAGAIKRSHKRMDYLVREFASFCCNIQTADCRPQTADRRPQTSDLRPQTSALRPLPSALRPLHLVIAGARENETDAVMREARAMLGDRVSFLVNHPFEQMPAFYKALDVFVLPSLFEMMGIVFAEAMASGVPAIAHDHPVMREVIGDGGRCIDMTREGVLADVLADFCEAGDGDVGRRARAHVERVYSKDVVIQKYVDYYERIIRA
jgi:glycosyltransferase involved in cell wall biosynthesis